MLILRYLLMYVSLNSLCHLGQVTLSLKTNYDPVTNYLADSQGLNSPVQYLVDAPQNVLQNLPVARQLWHAALCLAYSL